MVAMDVLAPLIASPFLFIKMRKDVVAVVKNHKLESLLVAVAGTLAYAIVLWAFQRSATAYVATLREFSVVIAAVLGVIILKESLYKRKVAGIGMILLGVICIKLA